jgi:hypothetical protein
MRDMNHGTPTKDQPSPATFRDLILALNGALKTRAEHMHDLEITFQINIDYSDHPWKS